MRARFLAASAVVGAAILLTPTAASAAISLDSTFGTGGAVLTDLGGADSVDAANDVLVQPDGAIGAAGWSTPSGGTGDFALVRYLANGALDPSFGTGGKVTTDFGGQDDIATALVRQPDGKLVVVGLSGTGWNYRFAAARYLANGTLDSTFGTGGKVLTNLYSSAIGGARAVALQSNGRIVVAGGAYSTAVGWQFATVRYLANGTLDSAFGTGGIALTSVSVPDVSSRPFDLAYAVAIQSNGRIVVAGNAGRDYGRGGIGWEFGLVRLTAAGALDTSFGSGGKTVTNVSTGRSRVHDLAVRSDGRIVVAGEAGASLTGGNNDLTLARYKANGTLDTAFGTGGVVQTDVNGAGSHDSASDLALRSDNGVLVAGSTSVNGQLVFAVARYGANGALAELVPTAVGDYDYGYGMAVQTNGRLVVGGQSYGASGSDFAVARNLP
ncbi:delta-60 repeat domain-containing protein [Tenggerimyces flavus]|uniref:Delta-60 repeat domain-containing protein n=1 Tax=Tenggerimyces flavus TaxID=1708749 RepID=A0ABV7YI06_9ACTN|nr:delta-60 repeat domain-containing protein [Tenggerimyces flavus]MBM7787578.1 putative delta-60 repeat protein [Tenggerimyces flavus]